LIHRLEISGAGPYCVLMTLRVLTEGEGSGYPRSGLGPMPISPDEIAQKIERFIRAEFTVADNDRSFTRDAHLYDRGFLDSSGVVELLSFVESTFDVAIEDQWLFSELFTTVNGITQVVATCVAGKLSGAEVGARDE
jgi:acyl carrier protein